MRTHNTKQDTLACRNYIVGFLQEYRFTALFGLLYGTILYALMMTQQLTNTFDGLWVQNSYYAGTAELSSGRWLLAYIDKLVMGTHADPIASIAALTLFITGFLFILDLFDLKGNLGRCLCLTLFISSTLISNTLSYRYTSLGYGLAYLFAALSVYAIIKIRNHSIAAVTAGVLLGLSMACYQAYLAVFCIVVVFYAIFRCKETDPLIAGTPSKSILCYLLRIVICVCIGALFYVVSLSLCLKLHKVSLSNYNGIGQLAPGSLISELPRNFLKTFQYFNAYFFMDKLKINRFQAHGIFYILMGLLAGLIIFIAIKAWKIDKKRIFLLLLAAAVIPVASNAYILLASNKLELQMTAGLAMFAPLTMLIAFSCFKETHFLKIPYFLLCILLTYGNSIQVYVDQEGMYEGQNACDTIITQVINDLNTEDLLSADYEYFFVGVPEENPLFSVSSTYHCANAYAQMGRFWVNANGSQASYAGLINRRMGLNLMTSSLSYENISAKLDVVQMPVFPADGYITLLDEDTVVVKISEHNAYTGNSKYAIEGSIYNK